MWCPIVSRVSGNVYGACEWCLGAHGVCGVFSCTDILLSIGVVGKDGKRSCNKGDFAIELRALVEAGTRTGYLAYVSRAIDQVKL